LESGRDYQTSIVRRDDSVGNAVIMGESAAGILSMGELRNHPEALRNQLTIVTTMTDVAGFVVSVAKEMPADKVSQLRAALLAFSQSSEEGKQFFQRSGFRAISLVNERELTALDVYVDKTRKALE
jgi:ABC-type phosphate/phosphonate transport system substrate-binding protein